MNFACMGLSALACLSLYHIAEETRVAKAELHHAEHEIVSEHNQMAVLQAEWAKLASPSRIQKLAEVDLGVTDAPPVELSSLRQLPRRGSDAGPVDGQFRSASAREAAPPGNQDVRLIATHIRD